MCLRDHGSLRSFERNQLDFFKKNKKSSCVFFSRLFILATKSLIPIFHIHVVVQLCLVLILCFFAVLVSSCSSLHCLICCLFGRFNIFNGKVFWSELTIPCTTRETESCIFMGNIFKHNNMNFIWYDGKILFAVYNFNFFSLHFIYSMPVNCSRKPKCLTPTPKILSN